MLDCVEHVQMDGEHMAKRKVEDRDSVTSRDGVTVAIRLSPREDKALKALVELEQAEIDARGSPYRASAASVLRTLLRAKAVAAGIWESAPVAPPVPVPSPDVVRAQVLSTLKAIDATRDGHHKLIGLPCLKDALPGLSGAAINAALLELESTREIDLKIANDPTIPDRPELGFRIPDRGLIYFAHVPPAGHDPRQRTIFDAVNDEKTAPAPTPQAQKTTPKRAITSDEGVAWLRKAVGAGAQGKELGSRLGMKDGVMVSRWLKGTHMSEASLSKLEAILPQLRKDYRL